MAVPLTQFVKHLADSGLMSAEEIAAFVKSLPPEKLSPDDAQPFARELIRSRKLTAFQAQKVYRGKALDLVLGNYVLLDELGKGGMGQVFKAEHRRMKRVVAVKVISQAAMKSPDAVKRFHREVQAAAKLTHPNIVATFDADQARGVNFMVMEHVDGSDLAMLVRKQGPLPAGKAIDCIAQAARGLEHAHSQGVVHRDIKPANLLIDREGTVKILDMGLARIDESLSGAASTASGLTQSGSIMGTVDYMSPEQALNTKYADRRADIYSLGCSLHYLVTSRPVYTGETLMEKLLAHREQPIPSLVAVNPEVPPALDNVFSKMVAKNAHERYQTMGDVLRDLERVAAGAPLAAPLLVGGDSGEDAAVRAFLAAISPAASGTEMRTKVRRPASETLVSQAAANTQTSLLRSAVKRVSTLSAWQRLIAAGGAVGVLLVVVMLMLNTRKPARDESAPDTEGPPAKAVKSKGSAGSESARKLADDRAGATGKTPEANKSADWANLLNGRDLTGWTALGAGKWRIEDGALTTFGEGKGWLMSNAEFADFELELEYKLPPGANSGIFLRAWPEGDVSGSQFLEIQLLDDAAPVFQSVPPKAKNGAIFAAAAPDRAPNAPAGQWNHVEIMVQGRKLQVFFNGQRIHDANLDDFREQFSRFPGFARERGRLGLQDYAPGTQFRKIRIRNLAR